ncbi:SdrD B-like domain-containing protein [Roseiflexus sp.]
MATSRSFHRNQRLHMRRWAAIAAAALTLSTLLAFFGSRVVSAVGDLTVRVYTDSNRNGQYDSEPGVSGVPVSVYNTDNNLLFSVNTNASGLAIFPNTPNGDYRVEVTNPGNGAPNGTVISLPGSTTPGQDNALVFFVTINNAPVQRDVGLRSLDASGVDTGAPAGYRTIVVRAWDDRDANGIQDAGEPGISGLTLGLYTPSNVLVATATTGPDGTYRFVDNVPANVSNYTIRVTGGIPAGYVLTTQDANFDSQDQRDSDAQLVAGEPRITVPNRPRGVNDDSLDVGFSRGAVSGFVWRDLDQNGLRDPGEPFINGVTVELRDSSDNLIGTPQTTRSILNDPASRAGFFEFTSVPLTATYRVRIPNAEFNNPTDLLFGHATPLNQTATPPAIGDQGLVNGTTDGPLVIGAGDFLQTPDFTLDATNRRNETSNFGLYAGTVGDFVWHDVNRNGIVDPLETTLGLANALVFVDLDSDCLIDTNELTTTTDLTGYYLFDSLPLGYTYTVVLDASNFAPGGALEGLGYTTGAACGSTEGVVITTTLLTANTPADFGVDFGIARAEIGNFVWEDDNGNGIFDLSESGVQSVTVQLYGAGPDGFFFTADDVTVGVSQTTNASGIYTITDILSGTYYARFDLSALPPNYVASVYTPTGWLSVDPLAQSSDDVNDVRAFVSGRVWRTPTFTITRGSQNPGVDAAVFRPVPLSGRVFFDQNGNNQDETTPEPGLANFTVNLRRASDDALVTTTTTLADGSYTFSSVAPLTYVVEIVRPDPTNWSFVTPDVPSAGDPLASDVDANGRTGVISVTSGITVTDVDAGLRGNNTVQGRVFYDRDGSFTQTGNDQDLSGATATLTVTVATINLTTTYTLTATTGASDPNYSFTGIPGGTSGVTYTLTFDPPDATYTPSIADVGGNDALDSDGPFIQVTGATVGVSNTLDYDQGYWRPVTVRARIFDEITNLPPDNVYSPGDTGITTATVTITTTNGTVTPLSSSGIDSTGVVTFTLPPTTTTYWLSVLTPAGFTPSPTNTGVLEVNTPSPLLAGDTAPSPATEFQFGYFRAATITGTVRFDRDADNILFADNEPGMQGVTVTLRLGGSDVLTTTTDATGAYTFTTVPPANNYSVRVINPDPTNFLLVTPAAGDNDLQTPVGDDADTATFNVAPGATVSGSSDAAVRGRATVTGQVWEDLDGDGVRDAGETVGALPGVTVNLTVTVNLPGRLSTTILTTTTTDASGVYTFTALPGWANASNEVSFTLRFATPSGWYDTLADVAAGAPNNDSDGIGTGSDQLDNQALQRNTTQTRDRGYYQAVTVVARVFEELTNLPPDNAYTLGDSGIPTATVTISTTNGTVTPLSATSIDATGLITFTLVPTDSATPYWVNVASITGFERSPGNTGAAQVIPNPTSGQTVGPSGLEFGHYRVVTVVARVFEELTNLPPDNAYTPGDTGIPTATVTITTTGGLVTPLSATPIDPTTGLITFTLVPTDSATPYWVNVAPIAGFERSPGNSGAAQVIPNPSPGQTVGPSGLEFGHFRPVTVVARVFEELTNLPPDNVYALGDSGIPTATVTITTTGGPVTPLSVSSIDTTGLITFTLVPTNSATPYWVNVAPIAGFERSPGNSGAAQVIPNPTPGQTVGPSGLEFGHYRVVTVVARVFEELTNLPPDNAYALGDSGIPTATVTITTTGGPVTPLSVSSIDTTGLITFTLVPTDGATPYWVNVAPIAGFERSPGNSGAAQVTPNPSPGQTVGPSGLEFGHFRSGTVRFDRDGDNILFADNEPGMQGVTVTLRLGGSDVLTTTTDATGAYTFTTVTPANNYSVRVINPDPTNFLLVTPAGGDNDMATTDGGNTYAETAPFSITSGAAISRTAAVRGRATVTGQVWEDLDGDGVRDAGETVGALPGVTVNLTVTVNLPGLLSTTITTNTTTNASGFYTFTALPGGTSPGEAAFTLRFATPSGWFDTLTDVGTQPASDDSDGIGTGVDQLDDQALGRGATETRDRGYYRPAVIQVRVFEETTPPINNGYAAGDAPIAGATVTLTPNVTLGGPFGPDATGIISYTVAPTTTAYTVGVTSVPAGYFPSPGNTGTATAPALLTSGQTITPLPFGYYRNGVISGTTWFDTNVNGTFDTGEPTMAGVTVTLYLNPDATANGNETSIGTFTTGDNGIYQFTNITPTDVLTTGTLYRVRFELPTGYAFTTQGALTTDNNSDANTTNGYTDRFSVGSNETVTYVDAGAVGNLSLSGTAWEDTDADGTFDAGETGLPGVTLTLTVTTSINSTNPTVTYTVTSGAGSPNFTFNQLPAGNYQLSVTAKPLGYLLSTTGTLSGTLPATGQNFGLYRTAAVGDRVWLDVNGNGTYDTGVDAGLPGVTVRLRDASTDVVISTTTTLASGDVGFYGFENVTPGSYVVEFVAPSGFQTVNNGAGSLSVDNDNDAQSNGRTTPFVLASNQISTTVDAGLIGDGSISGIAWIDENFDDIRNPGETQRVSGVQVTLTITPTALSSSLTLSTTTNASGVYTFTNLPPGTFVLTFTRPAGYFDITPRVGSNPTVDSDAPVATGTLGAGQSITTLDAGYRTQMRVFLPLIMAPMTPPDLVVEAFTVTPAKSSYAAGEPVLITVKVKNVGGSPTTVGFWVDLYINPSTPPTTPNVRWNDVCGISPCYGIAWYVNQSLAPGQSITLTSAPGQFAGPQSIWPGSFASGTNALYVYVDSYNPPVPTGAVVESNETNNRAQITGFVVAGASFSNGADPGAPSGAPDAPIALPPRELPGPVEP